MNLRTYSMLLIFGAIATGSAQDTSALAGAKVMSERIVPVPAGVSEELRNSIEKKEIPPPIPAPRTQDEWLKFQEASDTESAKKSHRLAKEFDASWESVEIGGVPCFVVTPREISPRFEGQRLVHIHGGAFVLGGGEASVAEAMWVADACKAKVVSIDYRRPPLHPFPAAIEDTVAVWKEVTKDQDPESTALFGSSAGGNLTLATTLKLEQLGLPLPGALFVGTPATDLEKTGDTWYTLQGLDHLGQYDGFIRGCFEVYVPSKDFSDPLVSPIHGVLKGFPPTILISGTRDLLLSDTVLMHRALRKAGVTAELHVYEGQSHGDFGNSYPAPESLDAQKEIRLFFTKHLKPKASR